MQLTPAIKPSIKLAEYAERFCAQRNYKFDSFIGSGAFKECFAITDANGKTIALKLLRHGSSRARLDREIYAMKQCSHPNVAKLYEVSTVCIDGIDIDLMLEEMLQGGTLQAHLGEQGLLSQAECFRLGASLISALIHISKHRIVHRDIKPANIMFRDDVSTPVLVDFGLVRNLGDQSLTQTWLMRGPGTPIFSSPEQLNNEKELIDWRSDQFALGLVLYFSLF